MLGVRALVALVLVAACGPSASMPTGDQADAGPGDLCPGGVCVNACPDGTSTTLSGTVMAPNGIDPIPFAQVYLPRSLQPFPPGVACEVCSEVGGDALIKTTTGVDGTFTLGPIPTKEGQASGEMIDVVVQKGRFRKVAKAVIESPCGANAAPAATTTLPGKDDGMNTVPKIAVATGDYDVMECVLLDFGLDPSAFDLYNGILDPFGAGFGTPDTLGNLDTLLASAEKMKQYNVIFLNCSNNEFEDKLGDEAIRHNIEGYVAAGGRLYVTDWSYDYVEQIPEFASVIDFAPDASADAPEAKNAGAVGTGGIELQGTVEDPDMLAWLEAVERATGDEIVDAAGAVHIEHFLSEWVMQLSVPMAETSKVWITGDGGAPLAGPHPLTTTFDYQECGRVLYSSYHTSGRGDVFDPDALRFPNYCADDGLLPQERILTYLISHVADCIDDVVE
jgi:hypothetical protein